MLRFGIRDKEAGNYIDFECNFENAMERIKQFEEEDKKDGTYTEDFYEIYFCDEEGKQLYEAYTVTLVSPITGYVKSTWSGLTEREKDELVANLEAEEPRMNNGMKYNINVELKSL